MKSTKTLTDSQRCSLPSKLSNSVSIHSNPFPPNIYYEPTSVLDPHATSSPASAAGGGDHRHLPPPPATEDWDPLSWLLSEKDNLSPISKPPQLNQTYSDHPNFLDSLDLFDPPIEHFSRDSSHLELVYRAAKSIETGDLPSAHLILSRLNHHVPNPSGPPQQHIAFYLKEALFSLLLPERSAEPPQSATELVRRISAHRAFSDLSPVPLFASFTTNQAILEAFEFAPGSGSSIHIIDFDLGLGGQWSSFAQAVATRSRAARVPPPDIRLTAIVHDETPDTMLAAENLCDFARSLGLCLAVDLVNVVGVGANALSRIHLATGEPVAVVLSPTMLRLLVVSDESCAAVHRFLWHAKPCVVMFVDTECFPSSSLSESVAAGFEFFSCLLESLEMAAPCVGAGDEMIRRVEKGLIRPRIFALIRSLLAGPKSWEETLSLLGLEPIKFSEQAVTQAELLIQRAPIQGYRVARRDTSLVLSWQGMELAATSAWRC